MKSKYKYVFYLKKCTHKNKPWGVRMKVNEKMWQPSFSTEKEAAISVDKKLIEQGKNPVNILKKLHE